MSVEIHVDSSNADAQLERLRIALSEQMIAQFFGGNINDFFQSRAGERFANQGDKTVGAWAPLHASTIAVRRRQGYMPTPVNVRSGEMRNWAVASNFDSESGGGAGVVQMIYPGDKPTGELKRKVERAQGLDPQTVPRPILGVDESDLIVVMDLLGSEIERWVG